MQVQLLTNGQFADTETGLIADSEQELICKVQEFNVEFESWCKTFEDIPFDNTKVFHECTC